VDCVTRTRYLPVQPLTCRKLLIDALNGLEYDIAGARTLMREINGLLKRRPGLGTLVGEAEALQPNCACFPCCPPTCRSRRWPPSWSCRRAIKSRMQSVYHKLDAGTRHQAVTRPVNWGS
jgi:hypothetical protein